MRAIISAAAIFALGATAASATPSAEPAPPPETQITIVLAGDTGLNGSFEPVFAGFGTKQGQRLAWHEASGAITRDINGDINFANLETVVTDRNDIKPHPKLFGFRTHPDGVRHLMRIGFNVFSTANNHAMDFGLDGARETLKHLSAIGVAHAGLGANRAEARAPRLMLAKARPVAFAALGIIGNGYAAPAGDEDRPGQLSYNAPRDFDDAAETLAAAKADYKILSVHYGQEFDVTTGTDERRRLTGALAQGADLVVGHHQHVPAGVEIVGGKAIFYGLGNFMHWGTQDMSRFDICRDYGLVARVHLAGANGKPLTLRAIEAIPITAMHKRPERRAPEDGAARIHVLNHLAAQFGANGVRFAIEADGTGLYCTKNANLTGTIGDRCRAGTKITTPPADLAKKIETACARRVVRVAELEGELEPEFAPVSLEIKPAE